MTKAEKSFLFNLLETPSPTGFEMPGQKVWAKYIGKFADSVQCDAYGSAWATLKGKSDKIVMLEAHADEIGYMIKHITKDGFLYLDRVGGSDAATGRGRRLQILGDKGVVDGIIGNTAIHLRRDNLGNEKAPKVHELWVDVGASSADEVAGMGLRVGHPAVYSEAPMEVRGKRIVSRAVDNRIGGFMIAQVMKKLAAAKTKPAFTLVCLNSVQEEIGGYGAKMATHRLQPDICLCTDVTHATDTPGLSAAQYGKVKLGGGPTVTHGTASHPMVVERLIEVARKKKIPLQHEASSRFTGTDTDSIYQSREGVPSALVSIPLRCMHSVVETVDYDDIEATTALMAGFVESLKAKDLFHQTL
ncbi:M42 family metallopeptidase [Akkermansiaceae bacterium]|nr:M42 family metallopeptidase [Akkermansiaceae bacterium]MDB4537513.1 M42 family metallopeptidase [Akkermansiaceae bacterium]